MTDGLKDKHRKAIIEILSAGERVERVVLFGSRAMGTFTATSDVDIALFGDKLTLTDHAKFAEAMGELSIPQHVDILLHKSIKNKELLKHIKRHGVQWYRRSLAVAGDWPTMTLAEAGVVLLDCVHKTPPATDDGLPYVAIPEMKGGRLDLDAARRISYDDFVKWTRKAGPQAHDVVLSRRCNPGETAHVPPTNTEFAVGQNLVLLRADGSRVHPPFLRWLARSPAWWDQIRIFLNVGAVFDSLKCVDVPNFELPIPPLDDQRCIAAILGSLDDKIELNRRMNETLEAMAKAIFKSWFIDFDPVRRNAARAQNQPSPQPSPKGRGSRNYRGGYNFAGLVEKARALRKKHTPAEIIFWELVRDRQFIDLKFRRQHQVGDYVVDFYCHEHRLVVEFDGGVHAAKRKKDHKRDQWMQTKGFTVLRFPNEQLIEDPESVLRDIAAKLPSPDGRGNGDEGVVEGEAPLPSPPGRRAGDEGVVEGEAPLPSPPGRRAGDEGVVESEAFDHLFPDSFQDSALGRIPKGWRVGSIGDVAENPRRGVEPLDLDSETPYIGLQDMPRRCIALDQWRSLDRVASGKFSFRRGDLLFGKLRPYFHKVGVSAVDGVCSTDILVVVPKGASWFGFVLGHISSDDFIAYTDAASTGTKMPRTNWKDMSRYEVALPPEEVAEEFSDKIVPLIGRIQANIHESRDLASTRDTLLPKLLSGEIRVKDGEMPI